MKSKLDTEIKQLTNEIMSGQIDNVQYLTDLVEKSEPMSRQEYIELIVRSLFTRKIKKAIRKKKQAVSITIGTIVSCFIAYILRKYVV